MQIITEFTRPDPKLVEELGRFSTALLGDALGRYGTMRSEIRPLAPGQKVVGPAMTVQTYPSDNRFLHVGLYHAQPGDVIVTDAGGYDQGGLWGEIMTLDAQTNGVAGLVVDGAVRDSREIRAMGFPVWSRAISPKGTQKSGDGSVGIPIACGGQSVSPGDIIVGDDDGVVVIPLASAERLLETVKERDLAEENLRTKIQSGSRLYNLLGLDSMFDSDD